MDLYHCCCKWCHVGFLISFFDCFVLTICKPVVAISDDIAYDEDRLRRHIVKAMVRQSQIKPCLALVVFDDYTSDDPGTCVRAAGRPN